ncbi:MAG: GNAT family N-acetyltransferase [Breznakia sp.]
MLDKTLPYYHIIMKANAAHIQTLSPINLPSGYTYKMYEAGDEKHWIHLEYSVQEFSSEQDAQAYFTRVFLPYKEILPERMCFILDPQGFYVATATAWFKEDALHRYAVLHWVSTSPKRQGQGLGEAIVVYALSKFKTLEKEKEIFLHTQSYSYKAVALYAKLGFKITKTPLLKQTSDPRVMPLLKKLLKPSIYHLLKETEQ